MLFLSECQHLVDQEAFSLRSFLPLYTPDLKLLNCGRSNSVEEV
jgi:hypothetical protein